jgi:FkbM family methyltransferase
VNESVIRKIVEGPLQVPVRAAVRIKHAVIPDDGSAKADGYDRDTIAIASRVLGRYSVAVDAGAHRGTILRKLVEFAPAARHIAVEPLPHLAHQLRRNFPTVTVHELALADYEGRATFRYLLTSPAESSLYKRPDREKRRLATDLPVRVARLDDLVPAGTGVRFIKIDVEGAEVPLLWGAVNTLLRDRPTVVVECASRNLPNVMEIVTPLGYGVSFLADYLAGRAFSNETVAREAVRRGEYYVVVHPREVARTPRQGR